METGHLTEEQVQPQVPLSVEGGLQDPEEPQRQVA